MKKTCENCLKRDSCVKLCDDIEKIANKDHVRRQYLLVDPDTFNDEDYRMDSFYSNSVGVLTEEMLKLLTDKQKEAIMLYWDRGKTQKNIGEKLNITQQAISKRLKNASKRLKGCAISYIVGFNFFD